MIESKTQEHGKKNRKGMIVAAALVVVVSVTGLAFAGYGGHGFHGNHRNMNMDDAQYQELLKLQQDYETQMAPLYRELQNQQMDLNEELAAADVDRARVDAIQAQIFETRGKIDRAELDLRMTMKAKGMDSGHHMGGYGHSGYCGGSFNTGHGNAHH